MPVGAEDLPVFGDRAIGHAVLADHGGARECRPFAHAEVDLVAFGLGPAQLGSEPPAATTQHFLGLQPRAQREQPQAGPATRRAFQPQGIVEPLAQHLESSAQADEFAAVAQMPA